MVRTRSAWKPCTTRSAVRVIEEPRDVAGVRSGPASTCPGQRRGSQPASNSASTRDSDPAVFQDHAMCPRPSPPHPTHGWPAARPSPVRGQIAQERPQPDDTPDVKRADLGSPSDQDLGSPSNAPKKWRVAVSIPSRGN